MALIYNLMKHHVVFKQSVESMIRKKLPQTFVMVHETRHGLLN